MKFFDIGSRLLKNVNRVIKAAVAENKYNVKMAKINRKLAEDMDNLSIERGEMASESMQANPTRS